MLNPNILSGYQQGYQGAQANDQQVAQDAQLAREREQIMQLQQMQIEMQRTSLANEQKLGGTANFMLQTQSPAPPPGVASQAAPSPVMGQGMLSNPAQMLGQNQMQPPGAPFQPPGAQMMSAPSMSPPVAPQPQPQHQTIPPYRSVQDMQNARSGANQQMMNAQMAPPPVATQPQGYIPAPNTAQGNAMPPPPPSSSQLLDIGARNANLTSQVDEAAWRKIHKPEADQIATELQRNWENLRQVNADKVAAEKYAQAVAAEAFREKERLVEDKRKDAAALLAEKRFNAAIAKAGAGASAGEDLTGALMMGLPVSVKTQGAALKALQNKFPQFSQSEIASRVATAKEIQHSIGRQIDSKGQLEGFENTVLNNLKSLTDELKSQKEMGNRSEIPKINQIMGAIRKAAGIPYNEAVEMYGKEIAGELEKMATSATAAGSGGTLSGRTEWQSFLSAEKGFNQLTKSIEAATQSARNRIKGSETAVENNQRKIEELWGDNSSKPSKSRATGGEMTLDEYLTSKGH